VIRFSEQIDPSLSVGDGCVGDGDCFGAKEDRIDARYTDHEYSSAFATPSLEAVVAPACSSAKAGIPLAVGEDNCIVENPAAC